MKPLEMSKNEAVRRILRKGEALHQDTRDGAQSMWLGPARPLKALPVPDQPTQQVWSVPTPTNDQLDASLDQIWSLNAFRAILGVLRDGKETSDAS